MQGGRKYNLKGTITTAASTTRAATIGNANVLPHTYFLQLSAVGTTPADSVNEYTLKRISAIGSLAVTSTTPAALGTGIPASLLVGGAALTGINATGEPTYTANSDVLSFSHNQHAVYAFYAPEGGEFEQDASVTKGLGLFLVAGATVYNDTMSWHWVE